LAVERNGQVNKLGWAAAFRARKLANRKPK